MIFRSEVIKAARLWIGTPFHPGGRLRGVGCDCVGLLLGVALDLGLTKFDPGTYRQKSRDRRLQATLSFLCPSGTGELGDILLFEYVQSGLPQHVGIASPVGIIHAHLSRGGVVEHGLGEGDGFRLIASYQFPGVQ